MSRVSSSRSRTARGRFAASGTQAFRNRECKECGTVWRPSCPRGVAVVFIAAGFVLPLSIIFIFGAFPNEARGFWSMGSVFVIAYPQRFMASGCCAGGRGNCASWEKWKRKRRTQPRRPPFVQVTCLASLVGNRFPPQLAFVRAVAGHSLAEQTSRSGFHVLYQRVSTLL